MAKSQKVPKQVILIFNFHPILSNVIAECLSGHLLDYKRNKYTCSWWTQKPLATKSKVEENLHVVATFGWSNKAFFLTVNVFWFKGWVELILKKEKNKKQHLSNVKNKIAFNHPIMR